MSKRIIFVAVLMGVAASSVWASSGDTISLSELESSLEKVQNFFTSGVMKIIFAIALAGMLVGLGLKREDPEAKKKFLMWAIAIGGLLGLQQIVDTFFTSAMVLVLV